MPTKITAVYDNPTDPEAFEAGYVGQVDLARAVPGVLHVEASKVWPKEDGTPTPAYRLIDLYFADYDAASVAVTTPEFGALAGSVFAIASGGVRIVFADVEAEK
ncbi:EthD family reductase [Luteimicrobium sp. DT211]|uniref:EthD family reductase n=1 Tax=Luteimicrobium sp. DT211 TaxID=3393412 RepID=UPI003CE84214